LSVIEQREVKQRLKEMDMPEIMEWFKQEGLEEGIERGMERGMEQGIAAGIRAKALEDARKLVEHGVSWEIITSATGVKPEDLG
jgi:flagellar biosynthesis/type III secretory pathway protein FliH